MEMGGIDPVQFSRLVDQARPIYDARTFAMHVEEDLRVMDQIRPDLVIGDFRHSLSVSCRLRKIKYINLTNAYWSPEIQIGYPMPEAPIVRSLGEKIFKFFLAPFAPLLLKINFFKMVFILRKSLARAGLNFKDYRRVIIDGDVTVFCDTPELIPLKKKLNHEIFVGPLTWSMPTPLPAWWGSLKANISRIFVSLGSSGDIRLLPFILKTLSAMDVEIIVALSGKKISLERYGNVYVTDFLPLEMACRKISLIICNGGSPMTHAALSWGVPTIGIVCNNDQLLNMAHVERRGAGLTLRYWNLTEKSLSTAVEKILRNDSFGAAAWII